VSAGLENSHASYWNSPAASAHCAWVVPALAIPAAGPPPPPLGGADQPAHLPGSTRPQGKHIRYLPLAVASMLAAQYQVMAINFPLRRPGQIRAKEQFLALKPRLITVPSPPNLQRHARRGRGGLSFNTSG